MERSRSKREEENEGVVDFFVEVFSISKYFSIESEKVIS